MDCDESRQEYVCGGCWRGDGERLFGQRRWPLWRKAVVGAQSTVTKRSYFSVELEHREDYWNVDLVRHAT